MHVRHQRRQLDMGSDQFVVHVARVAGGITQTQNAGYLCEAAQQFSESRWNAVGPESVIGIHILPDECYLAHASIGQPLDFSDDLFNWSRDFGSACIGHYAKRAELVATFL